MTTSTVALSPTAETFTDSQVTAAVPAEVDVWRACARVLNRVPAHLVHRPDGSIFFMFDLDVDTSVEEVADALDPIVEVDHHGDKRVVYTDAEEKTWR